jgi:hypothetical protein
MKSRRPDYNIYPTLLDAYQNYLDCDKIYSEYYGFSENPPMTEDEFHEKKHQDLIDRINRIPFDSEKADRGTVFNEIVDCIILGTKSDKMQIKKIETDGIVTHIQADYNERGFLFPVSICREFANYYKGAVPQVYTNSLLPTRYGDVFLYGYIDELMPMSVHDIKTTSGYTAGKFKNHWQHIVYPYCLQGEGNDIADFEYNILLINERKGGDTYETFTEHYAYVPERDIPLLTAHVESLISFLHDHRELITDKKIFNEEQQP